MATSMAPTWNLTLRRRESGTALRCQATSETPSRSATKRLTGVSSPRGHTALGAPLDRVRSRTAGQKRLSPTRARVRKQGELLVPVLEAPGEGSGSSAEGGFAPSGVELTSSGALASTASIVPRPLVFRANRSEVVGVPSTFVDISSRPFLYLASVVRLWPTAT